MADDPIRPNASITETPEPLEVVNTQPNDVDITVNPNAIGDCKVILRLLADDCGFLIDNKILPQIEKTVTAEGIFDSILVNIPFTIVCVKPSEEKILVRFVASAVNSEGGESHPSPFFNVNLSFDSGDRLSEIMASVEIPKDTHPDGGDTEHSLASGNSTGGVTETEINTETEENTGP